MSNDLIEDVGGQNHSLRILSEFSAAANLRFDRTLAARAMDEARRAIPGDTTADRVRRLVEVGESIDLRVQSLDCRLQEALALARRQMPVATVIEQRDGSLGWLLICETRGRKVRLGDLESGGLGLWISVRQLRKELGTHNSTEQRLWVTGQAALACSGASYPGHGHGDSHFVLPMTRLWALMRPEKRDLWVIVVFSMVNGLLLLASPIAVESLVNTVAFGRYLQPIIVLAILLFTFLAFAAGLRALMSYVVEILQRRLFVRLVADLAYRLPRVRRTALDSVHPPELVNRFFEISTVQKIVSELLLDAVSIILQTALGMVVLAFYHPFLLGFDLVLLAIIALITFGLGKAAVKTAIKESKAKYSVGAWLEELVRHPTAFKLHSGSQFALDRSDQLTVDYLEARKKHYRIVLRQLLFALGLQALAATALLGLGGWLVVQGQLSLGQLVAAELIVTVIVASFAKMSKHLESFYDLLASVDKLGHLLDLPAERHDKLFHLRSGAPAEIAAKDISYRYERLDGHGRHVLRDVTFSIRAGECVALIGPAGCGKSTLIDLLSGVRQPSAGRLELDCVDLRELRADSLREHLAVARSVEIFHGTLDENVHLNRPQITAQDVRASLATVGLLDEILTLPQGMNTVLMTDGAPLSATQSLRLMLARAIVGCPPMLLIDGTLDAFPDEMVDRLMGGVTAGRCHWTAVIATGRQSVIDRCDRTIRLGVEEGADAATFPVEKD